MSAVAEAQVLSEQLARLREERDLLDAAITTKQAILLDLEERTANLQALNEDALAQARTATERMQSLHGEPSQFLAQMPALQESLTDLVREAVDRALAANLSRALQRKARSAGAKEPRK